MFENVSVLECIGADVTHRLPIGKENSKKLLVANSSAAAEYIASLYAAWLSDTDKVCAVLHDPLAVYYLAEPQICDTVYTKVAVVTEGVAKGITLNIDAYSKANMNDACKNITQRVKVARDVDSERMIENFMLAF